MIRVVLRWIDSPWAFELMPGLNRLGRNPTNDFRVSDPSISSFHTELTVEGDRISVRDLQSTNGTYIDEARIVEGILRPNNVLRLGNVRFALDEVSVTPVAAEEPAPLEARNELIPNCVYHADDPAGYKCENCGAMLCSGCVTIVGQGKYEPTTMCPVCKGQCHPLPHTKQTQDRPSFLRRLTQTLRVPFPR